MYNYREEIRQDIRNYIEENICFNEFESIEALEEHLYEALWTNDRVTGNGSGSYTFDTYEAGQNLIMNFDLLAEAIGEFGGDYEGAIKSGEEHCDVTIRCYLLGECLGDVMREIEDDFYDVHLEMEFSSDSDDDCYCENEEDEEGEF